MISKIKQYKGYLQTSFLYLGSSLIVAFIGIAINPLMAMNLSPGDYAIIGYFTSFNLLLLPLLHFNMLTYFLRNYYRIPEERKDIVSDTILIGLIVVGFVIFVFFTLIFYIYSLYAQVEFPFFPYAIITFAQIYVSVFTTFYLTKLRIKREAKKFAKVSLINCFVLTSLTLLLVVYGKYGADGKLLAALLAAFIMAIYSFRKSITKWQFDFLVIKDALKFGFPLTVSAIFWYFLTGVDRLFLAELNDTYTFGIYSVAIQIVGYLTIFYTAVNNTFEPDIYKAIAENKTRHLLKLIGGILIIIVGVNFLFIILAPVLIGLLTADRYVESVTFAQILALQNITMACYYMVVKVIVGYGYVKLELLVRIIGAVVSVCMFKILIGNYGFYGAAWGQVFSFLILSIMGVLTFFFHKKKETNINS